MFVLYDTALAATKRKCTCYFSIPYHHPYTPTVNIDTSKPNKRSRRSKVKSKSEHVSSERDCDVDTLSGTYDAT